MSKTPFSTEEVSRAIKLLIEKTGKLLILSKIVDKYFYDFVVTHKTIPLSIMLHEIVIHISGQLARLLFDRSDHYKTISVLSIYNQIKSHHSQKKDINLLSELNSIEIILDKKEKSYKKFRDLSDKFYAHTELAGHIEEIHQLEISWANIKAALEEIKTTVQKLNFIWNNSESDFYENQYEYFTKGFWNLINLPSNSSDKKWICD